MTKRQGKGRPRRPKTKNQREIDELAAQQAADAAEDKIRSIQPQPVSNVGRCTVILADDDDGPLTLRDDTDLENDNSAGFGLTAKERADDRKDGARIGSVGGLWVGLRRIKVVYRLVYDVPNTPPRRFLHYILAEAADVPILKWRHLIRSRRSAGWAGAPDSIPPRTTAEFLFGRYRISFDEHGNRIWWPQCYGSGALPEEAFGESDVPPEASFANDIFCEELCDVWRPVVLAERHAKNRTQLRKDFAKLAENPEAAKEYDRFPPLPKTESYPSGKWRIRPFFPRLASIAAYPPPPPARAALLNRDRQRFYAYAASIRKSKQKNSNKRWSSAVVGNGIKKCTKAINLRRIEKPRTLTTSEEVYRREEDGALMLQIAPHCYVNARRVSASEFLGFAGQELGNNAPRAWQDVTPRDRLPETIWPSEASGSSPWTIFIPDPRSSVWAAEKKMVDQQITESRHCSSVYENRKSALAAPCVSARRGWFLSPWACSSDITYVLGEPVIKPRVWLAALVQEFLDRGGQIQICPPAKLSVERRKRGRPPLGEKAQTNPEKQKKCRDNKKLQNAAQDPLKPATALTVPPMSACPGVTASSPDCEAVTFGTDFPTPE
jgi:hypothetical protein